ncbi:AAA family ATPase [Nocardioides caldifontis]|uniref:AAA family ATPase n=1 Tax=Nocardioides caldifontis TaxID=2588938 RepID=UPI0011DF10DC|nr:AAA family ATPase [Nocardioides caldifontis]
MSSPAGGAVLVVLGGLPATGKSTVAAALARSVRAVHVRVDTIETAIARSEGRFEATNGWELPPGYAVGQDVAADQLRHGLHVGADSVNPVASSREGWRDVASRAGARLVEVEVVCSDAAEHRRRAEGRTIDVPGLRRPTWQEIEDREYEPWSRDRVVVDTAQVDVAGAVRTIRSAAGL